MSIEKKSIISNRNASKKAILTKASATQVSSTKLIAPRASGKLAVSLSAPKMSHKLAVSMAAPKMSHKLAVSMAAPKISMK